MNNESFKTNVKNIVDKYFKKDEKQLLPILNYLSENKTVDSSLNEFHKREKDLENDKKHFKSIKDSSLEDKNTIESLAKYLAKSKMTFSELMKEPKQPKES